MIRPSGNAVNLQSLLVSIASSHLRKNGQHCHVQKKRPGPGVRPRSLLQRQAARCAAVWRRAISAHWVLFYGYAGGLEQRKQTISCFKLCIICYSCGICINTERINLTLRYLFLHNIFLGRLTLRYPIGVETDSRTPPTIEPQYLKKKFIISFCATVELHYAIIELQ